MKDIKVSIIIPIYNMEKYLLRCLKSVMFQTLKEIEIICINDGSTDGSLKILSDCAREDTRIIIIDKVNTGYGDSMNIGLENASGEYIGIVESDDFIEEDMYEKLYSLAIEQSAEIVKSNYYNYFTEHGEKKVFYESLKGCKYDQIIEPLNDYKIFFASPSIWSAIYNREFLNKNEIRFLNTPGASYQDTSFYFKTCYCAKRMYLIKDAYLYYWMDNVGSSVNNPHKVFTVCEELAEIKRFILNSGGKKQWDIYLRFKFQVYMWNFYRLSLPYQYAFLLKAGQELQDDVNKGCFNKELWTDEHAEMLRRITKDIDLFYLENSKFSQEYKLIQEGVIMNACIDNNTLSKMLGNIANVIIYGAGHVGKTILDYLIYTSSLDKNKITFAVSDLDLQIEQIDGINVNRIDDLINLRDDSIVIVAVREKLQLEMLANLKKLGFKNYYIFKPNQLNQISQGEVLTAKEGLNG